MDAHRDEETAASPLIAVPAPGGRSHAADAHLLSAAFLFVFSAYSAAQNLQTSVNTVRARSSPVFVPLPRVPCRSRSHRCGRGAGGRPGHRLDGDPLHLLHALLRGRVARGHADGAQARARRRQQRLPALHPCQPCPDMVRASWWRIATLANAVVLRLFGVGCVLPD